MAILGEVQKNSYEKSKDTEDKVLQSTVETFSGNIRKCQLMFFPNCEIKPAKGSKLILFNIADSTGNLVALGGYNLPAESIQDGEYKAYSTKKDAFDIQAFLRLYNTGKLELNASGDILIKAAKNSESGLNGKIDINFDDLLTFNSGSDYAVRYLELKKQLDQLKQDFNTFIGVFNGHTQSVSNGVALAPATTGVLSQVDFSNCKVSKIKIPAVSQETTQ